MPFKKKSAVLRDARLVAMNIKNGAENRARAEAEKARLEEEAAAAAAGLVNQEPPPVCDGRRIVKVPILGDTLWCDFCDDAISLRFVEDEQRFGLASVFLVRCHRCLKVYKAQTDEKGPSAEERKHALYPVNLKAAMGCMDSGVGHEQLNKLFSVMNLPPVHRHTIIRAQKRVGDSLESVTKACIKEAILEEKTLTLAAQATVRKARRTFSEGDMDVPMDISPNSSEFGDPDDPAVLDDTADPSTSPKDGSTPRRIRRNTVGEVVSICVSGDTGWDTRGNGHSYNSKSSRFSLIGKLSRKITALHCASNYCAMCARGATPGDGHKCAKNYEGSSKGMEAFSASEVIANNPDFEEAGVVVGQYVGDKDSCVMARLRRDCSHPIEKITDLNHNLKGFSNSLWLLKKSTQPWLQPCYIDYFKRNLGYAIKQNKDDVEGVRAAIMNIERHVFGEHEECGEWCQAKEDPDKYVFKQHPKQKKFTEEDFPGWRSDLHGVLSMQAAHAETLAPCGSTQVNESFNHMAVTRAPKSRFCSGTNANYLRVSAAACEKNLGTTYTERVFKESLLSPSAFNTRQSIERKKKAKHIYQSRPDIKSRRLFLKKKNKSKAAVAGNKDGVTYVSDMGGVMERASEAASVGQAWLPELITVAESCVPVIIDLETTGLQATDQIVQIAVKCGSEQQSWYMVPTKKINPIAAKVTGLNMVDGELQHNGICVPTTTPKKVAEQLLRFLRQSGDTVFLVGHNIIRFDAPRIVKFLKEQGLIKDMANIVAGFTDTLPLLKQDKLKKQALLAKKFLTGSAWEDIQKSAHNALTDVIVLDGLVNESAIKVPPTVLRSSMVTFRTFMERQLQLRRRRNLMPDLNCFLAAGVSKAMVGKMAFAGITVAELRQEYQTNKSDGIRVCLGVQVNGKPRVTTSKKIIACIQKFFIDEEAKTTSQA